MRIQTFSKGSVIAQVGIPDERVMAFNRNFINFNVSGASYVEIVCNNVHIEAAIYNNKAVVDISRLLQLGFADPRNTRVRNLIVEYYFNGLLTDGMTFDIQVIWGYTNVGERLNTIGAYHYNPAEKAFVRNVRWFVNMPQKLCVYNGVDFELFVPTRTHYTYGVFDTTAVNDLVWDDTFDDTFKHTFEWEDNGAAEIFLTKDIHKCGYFLRWIDNLGLIQYFSFQEKETSDVTEDKSVVKEIFTASGIPFVGSQSNKSLIRKAVCAAVNVTPDEMAYVKTVVSSPIVDLYCGTDKEGNEMWMPVLVDGGEYIVNTKKHLQNFEITLLLPTQEPQSL